MGALGIWAGNLRAANSDEKNAADMVEKLKSSAVNDQDQAALALANIEALDPKALKPVVPSPAKLLEDAGKGESSAHRRHVVADILSSIGPDAKVATKPLTELLKDENARVRSSAAYALGSIGPDAKMATKPLTELLKDEDIRVRSGAAVALFKIKPDAESEQTAVKVLCEALKDKDDFTRTGAVNSLGKMGPKAKAALPDLKAVVKQGGMAAYYARDAIAKIERSESKGKPGPKK